MAVGATKGREASVAVALFGLTFLSVFATYGLVWEGGNPFRDAEVAWNSAAFAAALLTILLAHELGHYFVARRHGFALSLPWFIPVPFGWGTFGAVIRLRSLPRSRTALLEMAVAGPLAGAAFAVGFLALGLPSTRPGPEFVTLGPEEVAALALSQAPSALDWIWPPPPPGHVPVLIFNNPPVLDLLGTLILGAPPGRFDLWGPLAFAGWAGCFLTALNLLPIGQLDGGHVVHAVAPRSARGVGRAVLALLLVGGVLWEGWWFFALVVWVSGASRGLPVPSSPPLTARARVLAVLVLVVGGLCFMPRPIEVDALPVRAEGTAG